MKFSRKCKVEKTVYKSILSYIYIHTDCSITSSKHNFSSFDIEFALNELLSYYIFTLENNFNFLIGVHERLSVTSPTHQLLNQESRCGMLLGVLSSDDFGNPPKSAVSA